MSELGKLVVAQWEAYLEAVLERLTELMEEE